MGLTEKGEDEIIDKIVEKVIELDNNDSAYLKMLETPAFESELCRRKAGGIDQILV